MQNHLSPWQHGVVCAAMLILAGCGGGGGSDSGSSGNTNPSSNTSGNQTNTTDSTSLSQCTSLAAFQTTGTYSYEMSVLAETELSGNAPTSSTIYEKWTISYPVQFNNATVAQTKHVVSTSSTAAAILTQYLYISASGTIHSFHGQSSPGVDDIYNPALSVDHAQLTPNNTIYSNIANKTTILNGRTSTSSTEQSITTFLGVENIVIGSKSYKTCKVLTGVPGSTSTITTWLLADHPHGIRLKSVTVSPGTKQTFTAQSLTING